MVKKNKIKKLSALACAMMVVGGPMLMNNVNKVAAADPPAKIILDDAKMGAKYELFKTKNVELDGTESANPTATTALKTLSTSGTQDRDVFENFGYRGVYEVKQKHRAPGYMPDTAKATVEFPKLDNGRVAAEQTYHVTTKANKVRTNFSFVKKLNTGDTNFSGATFKIKKTHNPTSVNDDQSVNDWGETQDAGRDVVSEATTGAVTFNDLEEGKYSISEVATNNPAVLKSNVPITFTVTYDEATKAPIVKDITGLAENNTQFLNYSKPTVEKKIVTPTQELDEMATNVKTPYTYVLKVNLPNDINTYEELVVKDTLDSQLEASKDGVFIEKINLGDDTTNLVGTDKIKTNTSAFPNVNISFDTTKLTGGKQLKIYVKTQTVGNPNIKRIPNNFKIDYNNGKGESERDLTSNTVHVTIKKGKIKIKKTTSDGTTGLQNAKFKLYRKMEAGAVEDPQSIEVKGKKFAPAINEATGQVYDDFTVTNADGTLTIENLPHDEYVLKEVEAPNGYRLKQDVVEVTVDSPEGQEQIVRNYEHDEIVVSTGSLGILGALAASTGLTALAAFAKRKRK